MKKIFFLITIIYVTTTVSMAQSKGEDNLGNWLMYFGANRISEKLSIHTEGQYRLYGKMDTFNQLLLRTGLTYIISDQADITAGYAYIATESFVKGEFLSSSTENRIWQQLILKNTVGKVMFNHRYRVEQRWISNDIEDKYLNRLRYRLHFMIPLSKPTLTPKTVYLAAYDEIFIGITDDPFDQNRLYGGLGYKVNQMINIETGFLRNRIGDTNFNRLQFAIFINTDLRQSTDNL